VRSLSATVVAIPELGELATAVAWLKAERANIVAAAMDAARHGQPRYTLAIALRIWIFLDQAHSHDAIAFHTAALAATDDLGHAADPTDRAKLLGTLALAHHRLGELDEATARAEESIALLHRAGHKQGGVLGRYILASVRSAQGRFLEVLAIFEQTLDFARAHGPVAQVIPLVNLGKANLALERYETAADCFRQAADIAAAEQLGHHVVEARRGMAMVLVRFERFAEALPMAQEAVEVTREYGFPERLVAMLDTLAWAYRGLGQFSKAFDSLAEAIQICDGIAGSYRAAQARNTLGETHRAAGDHLSARDCHEEALELAESARDRKQRARALTGLGDAHAELGDVERARDCWKRAFDEYAEMGLPAAARVEARLRRVGP
jgi:tetratricopeptide (TPR) repeat protein